MFSVFLSLLLNTQAANAGALDAYAAAISAAPISLEMDARGTFRDLALGTTCSTVPGFAMVKDVGDYRSYSRSTDKLSVGTGTLTKIFYLCVDDKLRVVMMKLPQASLVPIATAMVGTYGQPSIKEEKLIYWRGVTRAAWLGPIGDAGDYMLSIGDFPWADPVGLMVMLTAVNAQAGKTDL